LKGNSGEGKANISSEEKGSGKGFEGKITDEERKVPDPEEGGGLLEKSLDFTHSIWRQGKENKARVRGQDKLRYWRKEGPPSSR